MDKNIASESLISIDNARNRAKELRGYRDLGSIVSLWGAVWLAGFGTQQFAPSIAPAVWLSGWLVALGWTFTRPRKAGQDQALASWCVAIAFVILLLTVIEADTATAAMICALALAAGYALLGIWIGKRFLALSSLVLAFACGGWWLAPGWLFGLLALGGGAGLMIGGSWLRRP